MLPVRQQLLQVRVLMGSLVSACHPTHSTPHQRIQPANARNQMSIIGHSGRGPGVVQPLRLRPALPQLVHPHPRPRVLPLPHRAQRPVSELVIYTCISLRVSSTRPVSTSHHHHRPTHPPNTHRRLVSLSICPAGIQPEDYEITPEVARHMETLSARYEDKKVRSFSFLLFKC